MNVQIGDRVDRYVAVYIEPHLLMTLIVTGVDNKFIYCGDWKFDRKTGAEVDEYLGWGPEGTGSFIKPHGT